jgi:hypothetical protein
MPPKLVANMLSIGQPILPLWRTPRRPKPRPSLSPLIRSHHECRRRLPRAEGEEVEVLREEAETGVGEPDGLRGWRDPGAAASGETRIQDQLGWYSGGRSTHVDVVLRNIVHVRRRLCGAFVVGPETNGSFSLLLRVGFRFKLPNSAVNCMLDALHARRGRFHVEPGTTNLLLCGFPRACRIMLVSLSNHFAHSIQ